MTAVLSPADALRTDRHLSRDDSQFDYSSASTDWRAKYHEVVDMLAETRNELEEFQATSKELEAELEADLLRSDKQEKELKAKAEKAETERDEWKSKYMSLQTTHNSTTTSLQRELDQLRQEHQRTKVELRDLELGADDLERSKRATSSSLVDMEAKYAKTLEEKIILEQELLEKASLEEEMQRVRDELRDSQDEVGILREQLASATATPPPPLPKSPQKQPSAFSRQQFPNISMAPEDDLLHSSLPTELQLSELSPIKEPAFATVTTPKATTATKAFGQSLRLQRAGLNSDRPSGLPSPVSGITRSTTLSSIRSPAVRAPTIPASSSTSSTAKNKGVQMVSEMRAKVRNLEQKIHTRVPRIRMGSITGRANAATSPINVLGSSSSSSSGGSLASTAKTSLDSIRRSVDSRRSNEKSGVKDNGDSSGWVLIMEDSPSPKKQRERERQKDKRRASSPSGPNAYQTGQSKAGFTAPSPTFNKSSGAGIRRPVSRLSGASLSTTTTSSFLPTPTSRPSTPTFIPVPVPGVPTSSSGVASKRSATGPSVVSPFSGGIKRTSLGTNGSFAESFRERSSTITSPRPGSSTSSNNSSRSFKYDEMKSLPYLPSQSNSIPSVTFRPNRLPSSASAALSKSRIGRPAGIGPRRSGGAISDSGEAFDARESRSRYAS